jgi:cysteine desulfurase/selenocysteine lyase
MRAQFPILEREVHGRPLVYLDNAASVQKPQVVLDTLHNAMAGHYANVHRGLHTLATETTSAFEKARTSAARYLNAPRPEDIVFTSGGTDAVNLVANAMGQAMIGEGDEIVLSVLEHHSNIVPWHFLRERRGAVLRWVEPDADGNIQPEAVRDALTSRTRIVALTAQSNVLGTVTPIREIAQVVHEAGAWLLVDGCQLSAHGPVDVQSMDADFYVATGHKCFGPTGIGLLYGKADILAQLPPFRGGGEMIDVVERERVTYAPPPHRFEAGTPPILEAIGLGAALEWVMDQDLEGLHRHEAELTEHLVEGLDRMNTVDIYGRPAKRGPVVSFNLRGAHPHDVATILDRQGIAVRAGHHCCQPLMRQLGVSATARASFAAYNTHDEVETLLEGLVKAHDILG